MFLKYSSTAPDWIACEKFTKENLESRFSSRFFLITQPTVLVQRYLQTYAINVAFSASLSRSILCLTVLSHVYVLSACPTRAARWTNKQPRRPRGPSTDLASTDANVYRYCSFTTAPASRSRSVRAASPINDAVCICFLIWKLMAASRGVA